MAFPSQLSLGDFDHRVKRYLLPKRILQKTGTITNADYLLSNRERQVTLQEGRVVTMHPQSSLLLDFGAEFHGGAQISVYQVTGEACAAFRLTFGESVSEALSDLGEKGSCNDHSARDFTVEMPSYSNNEFGATGYRFLSLHLINNCTVSIKTVQGVFVYTPYEAVGSFECSDQTLNQIYDTAAYTCHLCMQNELWDGIKRDRLIWIGDLSPELKTIKYIFGETPEIMRALMLSAQDAVLPKWINQIPTYSLWWLINLEEWYFYSVNAQYPEQLREYTVSLIRQILYNVDKNGYFMAGHFIDWPTCEQAESREGTRALLILCLRASARLCELLEETELAEKCRRVCTVAEKKTAGCGGFKQLAALMKLTSIGDKSCDETLRSNGAKGLSTFMSYYIFTAMMQVCEAQEVFDVLKEYYGAMLDMGATTFWEDFDLNWLENTCRIDEICPKEKRDLHGDHGDFCYRGFRHSLCHGWASGPVAFLTETVLGVEIAEAGCKVIKIHPNLGNLSYAKGSIATPFGKVEISHKRLSNSSIETDVHAPPQINIILE